MWPNLSYEILRIDENQTCLGEWWSFSSFLDYNFQPNTNNRKKKEKEKKNLNKLKRRLITLQKPKKGHQNYFFMLFFPANKWIKKKRRK